MRYFRDIASTVSDRVTIHGNGASYTAVKFGDDITRDDFKGELERAFGDVYLSLNFNKVRRTSKGVAAEFSVSNYVGDLLDASKNLIENKDYDAAVKHLNIASILDMDNSQVHRLLGEVYEGRGEHEKASQCFHTAYNLIALEMGMQ